MSWEIRIPHRFRDEPLSAVAGNMRQLPPADRDPMRQLVLNAHIDGLDTAGQLLDRLDGLEPHERRALLDAARAECGLEPTAVIDERERHARPRTATGLAITEDPRIQRCHFPGCHEIPVNEVGALRLVAVKRWHCSAHEQHAEPGDMSPPPARGSTRRAARSLTRFPTSARTLRPRAAAESSRRVTTMRGPAPPSCASASRPNASGSGASCPSTCGRSPRDRRDAPTRRRDHQRRADDSA